MRGKWALDLSAKTGLPPVICKRAVAKFGNFDDAYRHLLSEYCGKQSTNDIDPREWHGKT